MRVEFDWTPDDNDSADWVAFSIGFPNGGAEPAGRVNNAGTDFGIRFRNNGETEFFDNSTPEFGGSFDVTTVATHHVTLDYAFTSFADGTSVSVTVAVDGSPVVTGYIFDWAGNNGTLAMELGNLATGTLIDNFSISTLGIPQPDVDLDGLPDAWEQAKAGNRTDLTGLLSGTGPGANTGNFDADSLTDDQEYSFGQVTFPALNPKLADTDSDGLEDGSEITPTAPRVATNPTIADTDGDGLSDGVESNTEIFVDQDNAGSNPLSLDTDNDQFPDAYEVRGRSNPSDAAELPPVPAGFVLGIVTDEVSTGISPDLIYTHKISGGGTATVNEVTLDNLNTTETPENFEWDPGTSRKLIVATPTNNNWNPAGGDVTGAGNLRFFGGFTYAGDAATAGGKQTFTLSGLEPGKNHEFRLYIRKWANDTVRPSLLRFINGTTIDEYQILEDRPGIVTGTGNDNTAYYISYTYVTQGTDLVMEAIIPNVSSASGSFHMFGLTNRQTDAVVPPPVITSIVRTANGASVTLTTATQPGRTYAVDYSTLLTPSTQPGGWVQITNTFASQGAQTEFVDTQFSTLPGAYYRVRDVTP